METKKQKIIKVLKRIGVGLSIGFNFLFLLAIIIGSTASKKQVNCCLAESDNVVEKLDIKQDNKRFVSYNDESYTITLNSAELNNYLFDNLYDTIQDFSNVSISGSYNNNSLSGNIWTNGGQYDHKVIKLIRTFDGDYHETILFGANDSIFEIDNTYSHIDTFEHDLLINFGSEIYSDIKNAIELDIQANESNINDGIFETLTASVAAFVGSLGNGIVAMTSVFYDSANSQLTTIGLLSVIVVAVSLAYFLFRLIIGLIRMRG